ncbi:hypothetical protein YB2330_006607 [Saitoella coloradoensis]
MTFNTATVAAASTPTFFKTFLAHFLKHKSTDPTQDPTHALSYHEALALVRRFLEVASHHTVDEVQAFTAMHVPIPRWVHDEVEVIPSPFIDLAASVLQNNLGQEEIEAVGGREWWQIRHSPLDVEWIEMKRDYITRQQFRQTPGHDITKEKVMLYIHGGAYYFGAVDEHRYQIQRHARKLGARACAPRYRLAPQYPFPCCLHDNLSAYLWLIAPISEGGCGVSPKSLILAGDSAGGGAALSLACILRDQGLPLPAGLVLISPWVDLTHSFPSVVKDNSGDYIPAHGFLHKPSLSWPPPTQADISAAERGSGELERHIEQQGQGEKKSMLERLGLKKHKEMEVGETEHRHGYDVTELPPANEHPDPAEDPTTTADGVPKPDHINPAANHSSPSSSAPHSGSTYGSARRAAPSKNTSIIINNTLIQIRDQIQLYAPNELLAHRLVSPVMQEDLGGLCPTLVIAGGAEMLRDEIIWIGHAMAGHVGGQAPGATGTHAAGTDSGVGASTSGTPTGAAVGGSGEKYPPTKVKLMVWDGCCHVTPTLSFTRPARYMYRAVANWGVWCIEEAWKEVASQSQGLGGGQLGLGESQAEATRTYEREGILGQSVGTAARDKSMVDWRAAYVGQDDAAPIGEERYGWEGEEDEVLDDPVAEYWGIRRGTKVATTACTTSTATTGVTKSLGDAPDSGAEAAAATAASTADIEQGMAKTSLSTMDDGTSEAAPSTSDYDSDETAPPADPRAAAPITMTGLEGPFHNNMIRLRVDTHGRPRPMEAESEMYQLAIPLEEIGVIKEGPVKRWMEGKSKFDAKYKKAKLQVQKERATAYARAQKEGFVEGRLRGERPPPSAVVSRSTKEEMEKAMQSLEEARGKTSAGLASWVETMQKKEHK